MDGRLLFLETPGNTRMSLAYDESLYRSFKEGDKPILRFYRHDRSVIIGYFQIAEEEVDLDYMKRNNIMLARRYTGGGAVYHDLGDLNFSVITESHDMNITAMFRTMNEAVVRSLSYLGLQARPGELNDVSIPINKKTDIMAGEKKIMGAAGAMRKGSKLWHAAMLVKTDLDMLSAVLKVPDEKFRDKLAKSTRERVANVTDFVDVSIEDVEKSLIKGISEVLKIDFKEDTLRDDEENLAKDLYDKKYSTEEWNMGLLRKQVA
ncbi:lipoate-protein ligase [Thermoplasma volcanium GSS1]|uniref:Lipoate-protein ligase n=1 Tax=Thermoplasma volcanium (strain ATCC 51530 / DSM 4299 / JCM 9571 / NBRC 15438 / GSS1) TaxID=273116 RepID=Q979Y9_THEVO|nr:biotin/lipoate A/B protein ligase family protein [Thermoplasma volcanium]BAB60163.1 lipoate-protein ligase [Thermoplasma volcanium GSS1]